MLHAAGRQQGIEQQQGRRAGLRRAEAGHAGAHVLQHRQAEVAQPIQLVLMGEHLEIAK